MPQHLVRSALVITLTSLLTAGGANAAPTNTKFDSTLQVQGTSLQLNGTGTRYKAIFKVYDMALYAPRKASSVEELLAQTGAKRLQFTALRDLSTTDLGRLFIKGMSENSSKELMQKHTVSTGRLIDIFSTRSRLMSGDTFAMEFVPGKGTQFYLLNKPQGDPVGDAEFFSMILKIWLGPSPADPLLKDALLGQ
jgi:hypothetical protein